MKTRVDLMDALRAWHEAHLSPAQNKLLGQVIEELARLYMVQHHAVEAARAWSTPDEAKPVEGHPVWWHILDVAGEQKAGIPESSGVTCCVQCSCAGQGGRTPHDPHCPAHPDYDFGKST